MREELFNKKEPGLNDFGNYQTIEIIKDVTILRFTVRKACSKEKTKLLTGQPFASYLRKIKKSEYSVIQKLSENIKHVTQISGEAKNRNRSI